MRKRPPKGGLLSAGWRTLLRGQIEIFRVDQILRILIGVALDVGFEQAGFDIEIDRGDGRFCIDQSLGLLIELVAFY